MQPAKVSCPDEPQSEVKQEDQQAVSSSHKSMQDVTSEGSGGLLTDFDNTPESMKTKKPEMVPAPQNHISLETTPQKGAELDMVAVKREAGEEFDRRKVKIEPGIVSLVDNPYDSMSKEQKRQQNVDKLLKKQKRVEERQKQRSKNTEEHIDDSKLSNKPQNSNLVVNQNLGQPMESEKVDENKSQENLVNSKNLNENKEIHESQKDSSSLMLNNAVLNQSKPEIQENKNSSNLQNNIGKEGQKSLESSPLDDNTSLTTPLYQNKSKNMNTESSDLFSSAYENHAQKKEAHKKFELLFDFMEKNLHLIEEKKQDTKNSLPQKGQVSSKDKEPVQKNKQNKKDGFIKPELPAEKNKVSKKKTTIDIVSAMKPKASISRISSKINDDQKNGGQMIQEGKQSEILKNTVLKKRIPVFEKGGAGFKEGLYKHELAMQIQKQQNEALLKKKKSNYASEMINRFQQLQKSPIGLSLGMGGYPGLKKKRVMTMKDIARPDNRKNQNNYLLSGHVTDQNRQNQQKAQRQGVGKYEDRLLAQKKKIEKQIIIHQSRQGSARKMEVRVSNLPLNSKNPASSIQNNIATDQYEPSPESQRTLSRLEEQKRQLEELIKSERQRQYSKAAAASKYLKNTSSDQQDILKNSQKMINKDAENQEINLEINIDDKMVEETNKSHPQKVKNIDSINQPEESRVISVKKSIDKNPEPKKVEQSQKIIEEQDRIIKQQQLLLARMSKSQHPDYNQNPQHPGHHEFQSQYAQMMRQRQVHMPSLAPGQNLKQAPGPQQHYQQGKTARLLANAHSHRNLPPHPPQMFDYAPVGKENHPEFANRQYGVPLPNPQGQNNMLDKRIQKIVAPRRQVMKDPGQNEQTTRIPPIVREGDWKCSNLNCGNINWARRDTCNRCGKSMDSSATQTFQIPQNERVQCGRCQSTMNVKSLFCGYCGAARRTQKARQKAEQRHNEIAAVKSMVRRPPQGNPHHNYNYQQQQRQQRFQQRGQQAWQGGRGRNRLQGLLDMKNAVHTNNRQPQYHRNHNPHNQQYHQRQRMQQQQYQQVYRQQNPQNPINQQNPGKAHIPSNVSKPNLVGPPVNQNMNDPQKKIPVQKQQKLRNQLKNLSLIEL